VNLSQMMENGYQELQVTGQHAVAIDSLPPLRKNPFDRLLIAQAKVEGITLLTADAAIARYPDPVRKV
jgi:PIN domain nuclease of toxin-antitoxin system